MTCTRASRWAWLAARPLRDLGRGVHAAVVLGWKRRRAVLGWTLALFALWFVFRGGLAAAPPGMTWPWPVGTVKHGRTLEPYWFVVASPRYLVNLLPFSMLRWLGIAVLGGWALALLGLGAQGTRPPAGRWGVGAIGLVAGLGSLGSCCAPFFLPAALAGLAGAGAYARALDGVLPALYLAVIVWQGQRMAGPPGCERCGKE